MYCVMVVQTNQYLRGPAVSANLIQKILFFFVLLVPFAAEGMPFMSIFSDTGGSHQHIKGRNECELLLRHEYGGFEVKGVGTLLNYRTPFGSASIRRYSQTGAGGYTGQFFIAIELQDSDAARFADFRIGNASLWEWILEAGRLEIEASGEFPHVEFGPIKKLSGEKGVIVYVFSLKAGKGGGPIGNKVLAQVQSFARLLIEQIPKQLTRRRIEDLAMEWGGDVPESRFYYLFKEYFEDYIGRLSPVDYLIFMTQVLEINRTGIEFFFGDLGLSSPTVQSARGRGLIAGLLSLLKEDPSNKWEKFRRLQEQYQAALESGQRQPKNQGRRANSYNIKPSDPVGPSDWVPPAVSEDPFLMQSLARMGHDSVGSFARSFEDPLMVTSLDIREVDPGAYAFDGIEFLGLPRKLEENLRRHGIVTVPDLLVLTADEVYDRFGVAATTEIFMVLEANGYDLFVNDRPTRSKINPNRLMRAENALSSLSRYRAKQEELQ